MGAPPPTRDPLTGCLLWQGTDNGKGYGTDWSTGKPRLAHYVAWEAVNGPVPGNRQLNHICRRRRCIQIAHLELVTQSSNLLMRSWAARSKQSKCAKGHDLWLNGRRTPEGGCVCLVCSGVNLRSR